MAPLAISLPHFLEKSYGRRGAYDDNARPSSPLDAFPTDIFFFSSRDSILVLVFDYVPSRSVVRSIAWHA